MAAGTAAFRVYLAEGSHLAGRLEAGIRRVEEEEVGLDELYTSITSAKQHSAPTEQATTYEEIIPPAAENSAGPEACRA